MSVFRKINTGFCLHCGKSPALHLGPTLECPEPTPAQEFGETLPIRAGDLVSAKQRPNDVQVGGDHYKKYGDLQPWDVVVRLDLDYFQGVIFKYLVRWKDKHGVEDLKKARHFLDKYIEVQEHYGKALCSESPKLK